MSDYTVTKSRSVLTVANADLHGSVAYTSADEPSPVEFSRHRHVHYLHRDLYDEMGRPDTITVTVEPGDLLNDAADEAAR